MKNFRDLLKEELKDPEFKKEWDALEPEFRRIKQQLDAQNEEKSSARHMIRSQEIIARAV